MVSVANLVSTCLRDRLYMVLREGKGVKVVEVLIKRIEFASLQRPSLIVVARSDDDKEKTFTPDEWTGLAKWCFWSYFDAMEAANIK